MPKLAGKNAIPYYGRKRIFAFKISATPLSKCITTHFPSLTFYQTGYENFTWDIHYPICCI